MLKAQRGTIGSALVAVNVTASVPLQTTPAALQFPTVLSADPQFNSADGTITFADNIFLSIIIHCNFATTGADKTVFLDGEFYIDGVWIRSQNTCRARKIRGSDGLQTGSFGFHGYLPAGTKVRIVVWSDASGVTMTTVSNSGSTSPAASVSYTTIIGTNKNG